MNRTKRLSQLIERSKVILKVSYAYPPHFCISEYIPKAIRSTGYYRYRKCHMKKIGHWPEVGDNKIQIPN
jgi:hypothetical protein